MPIYQYQGQEYDLKTSDPTEAEAKIKSYLGKEQPSPAVEDDSLTQLREKEQLWEKDLTQSKEELAGNREAYNLAFSTPPPRNQTLSEALNDITKQADSSKDPKQLQAEAIAWAEFGLGLPEWAFGAVFTGAVQVPGTVLGNLAAQIKTGDKSIPLIDWDGARERAAQVVSPLGNLKVPAQALAKAMDLEEEVAGAGINQVLGGIGEFADTVAEKVEETTGIPKGATLTLIDTAMLVGVPGVRALKTKVKDTIAPAPAKFGNKPFIQVNPTPRSEATAPLVEVRGALLTKKTNPLVDSLDVPKVEANYKAMDDSLYQLQDLKKLDETKSVNLDKKLEKLGVPLRIQEKFRRYDEGFAKGFEDIPGKIYEIQKEVNSLYAHNKQLASTRATKVENLDVGLMSSNKLKIRELQKEKKRLEESRGDKEVLTTVEREIYDLYYEPMKAEIMELSRYLEKENRIPNFGHDGNFAPRKRASAVREKTIWQTYKEAVIGRDYTEIRLDLNATPAAGKARDFFVIEDALEPTKREVVSIKTVERNGDTFQEVFYPGRKYRNDIAKENGQAVKNAATYYYPEGTVTTTGSTITGLGKVAEATVGELERSLGKKFEKNYAAVLAERLGELRNQARVHEFEKSLLDNKELTWSKKNSYDVPPEGYSRLQFIDKMPLLEGKFFPERIKEVLDEYNRPYVLTKAMVVNNTLVTNMMLVPIAHMHNELVHWGVTRGATGIANPKRLADLVKTLPAAYKDVKNRGPLFQDILREGGALMSTNIRNSMYMDKMYKNSTRAMTRDPGFKAFAKEYGKAFAVKPAELYKAISKASNKSMWTVRDIMVTQLIMEKKMHGLSTKQAIKSVERHMPNYRLPSRVIMDNNSGRILSKMLNNRSLFLFSRYHTGMVASAKNTLIDLVGKNPDIAKSKSIKEGVDSALALGIAMSVIYPMMDDAAGLVADVVSDMTGEAKIEEATFRRAGILHVFDTMMKVFGDKKDVYSLSSILMTPSPVFSTVLELARNKELYNDKNIVNFADPLTTQGLDGAGFFLRKVPQVGAGIRATADDYGTGTAGFFLRNFFDIKTRTSDQIDREIDQVDRKKEAALNRQYGD